VPELISSLPTAARGVARGKMTPKNALLHPHKASKDVKKLFDEIDSPEHSVELNLYVVGYEDDIEEHVPHDDEPDDHVSEQGAQEPETEEEA
jgi:succinate dehydrogenase / fumarate reductase iron-sulfur subunit